MSKPNKIILIGIAALLAVSVALNITLCSKSKKAVDLEKDQTVVYDSIKFNADSSQIDVHANGIEYQFIMTPSEK